MQYALLQVEGGIKTLAEGTHSDLSKEIKKRRQHGQWRFPVLFVSENTKFTTDDEYLGSMSTEKEISHKVSDDEVAALIRAAYKNGAQTVKDVKKQVPMAIDRLDRIVREYHLHEKYYLAVNREGKEYRTRTITDMAARLDTNPGKIKTRLANKSRINGFMIRQVEKWG